MRRILFRVALALALLVAVEDTSFAQERSTSAPAADSFHMTSGRTGPAPFNRDRVLAASSDEQFLAVWIDQRSEIYRPRVWGTRVARDGTLLDPVGFPVSALDKQYKRVFSIASDGRDFLVAWGTCQSYWCDYGKESADLRLTRVTAEGRVQSEINPGFGASDIHLAWSGNAYAAVFRHPGSAWKEASSSARVVMLDADGKPLGPARELLRSAGGIDRLRISINAASDTLLAIWTDLGDRAVHAHPFPVADLGRGPVVPPEVSVQTSQNGTTSYLQSAATDGISTLVTWTEVSETIPGGQQFAYRARRIDARGLPAGPLVRLSEDFGALPLKLLWTGSSYELLSVELSNGSMMRRVRLSEDGVPLGEGDRLTRGDQYDWSAATCKGDLLVVWKEGNDHQRIRANVFTENGTPAYGATFGALSLSDSVPYREHPAGIWLGNHYLLLWTEITGGSRLFARRYDVSGKAIGEAVDLGTRYNDLLRTPVVAGDGASAVVALDAYPGVNLTRFDAAGNQTSLTIPTGDGASRSIVHWNGTQYLVAWVGPPYTYDYSGSLYSVMGTMYAIRLDRLLNPIDEQAAVIGKASQLSSIGWTGRNYVAVWLKPVHCMFQACSFVASLWASSFSEQLTPMGRALQLAGNGVGNPIVGEGPEGLLIVWPEKYDFGGPPRSLRATRVSPQDIALDPMNGFLVSIGTTEAGSIYPAESGWVVAGGPYTWTISPQGVVGPRVVAFPSIPETGSSALVHGGPAPLLLYRRPAEKLQPMPELLGTYLSTPSRKRVARRP